MIETRVFNSISESEDLRVQWRHLLTQCPHATPFHSYEWTKANLCAFKNEGVRILVFMESPSKVIGILPIVLKRGRRYLNVRRWAEFAGLPHADHGGDLICPGYEPDVAQAFLDFLKSEDGANAVCLEKLKVDDAFAGALLAGAEAEGWLIATQPTESIRRLSAEEYFQTANPADLGSSLEKSRRKLASRGELQFEVFQDPDQINGQMEEFARLHIERFSSLGMESPFESSAQRHFYSCMIEECAPEGYVWFSRLTCAGVPVAMRFSLVCNQTLHLYSTCFVKEFSRFSPAVLQLKMLLDYAFHNGIRTVDFGVGDAPHKQQAGATVQSQLMKVELYRNRAPWVESHSYEVADRIGSKWPLFRRAGRTLRKLFPYQM